MKVRSKLPRLTRAPLGERVDPADRERKRDIIDDAAGARYVLAQVGCTDEDKRFAAKAVVRHIATLPLEERFQAWEDIAGALGLTEHAPLGE